MAIGYCSNFYNHEATHIKLETLDIICSPFIITLYIINRLFLIAPLYSGKVNSYQEIERAIPITSKSCKRKSKDLKNNKIIFKRNIEIQIIGYPPKELNAELRLFPQIKDP